MSERKGPLYNNDNNYLTDKYLSLCRCRLRFGTNVRWSPTVIGLHTHRMYQSSEKGSSEGVRAPVGKFVLALFLILGLLLAVETQHACCPGVDAPRRLCKLVPVSYSRE